MKKLTIIEDADEAREQSVYSLSPVFCHVEGGTIIDIYVDGKLSRIAIVEEAESSWAVIRRDAPGSSHGKALKHYLTAQIAMEKVAASSLIHRGSM